MEAKSKVLEWISKHFNLTKVKLKNFPSLPGGTLVIDRNQNITKVFYDSLNEKVLYILPNDSAFKTAV